MRRLPPLSALPAFEATARLGSVTAAALDLGRTHSAISKQISHLSDDLGGALFEKSGNRLRLTARGERLRKVATATLDELEAVAQALRSELDDHHVDLVASATFVTRWLIPRLPNFYKAHPDVEIRLRMAGPQQVPEHEADIVLSYDRLRNPEADMTGNDCRSLGDTAYGLVCAPDYPLRRVAGGWAAPVRLSQDGALQNWQAWTERAGVSFRAEHEVVHAHHLLALEAAAAGLGVALAEWRLVEQDLTSGRLVAPAGFFTVQDGLQLTILPRARGRKAVETLVRWLADEAKMPATDVGPS